MEVVGMKLGMDIPSLLVRLVTSLTMFHGPRFEIKLNVILWFYWEQDKENGKCVCPPGFKGDGVKSCVGKRTINLAFPPAEEHFFDLSLVIDFRERSCVM